MGPRTRDRRGRSAPVVTPRTKRKSEPRAASTPAAVIPVVHAVTTDDIVGSAEFLMQATAVMRALGPRGAVHLRAPEATGRRLFDIASALAPLQEETGAWLVVNDRIDVALATGARGVQLTSRSMAVANAQRAIDRAPTGTPRPAIGASVHSAGEAAAAAGASVAERAAWIVAGHVFPTASHPGAPGKGTALLTEICRAVSVPVIAIGGVQPSHVPLLIAAGAYGIAAIRGIWRVVDAERAAAHYLSAYDSVRDASGHGGSGG